MFTGVGQNTSEGQARVRPLSTPAATALPPTSHTWVPRHAAVLSNIENKNTQQILTEVVIQKKQTCGHLSWVRHSYLLF